MSTYPDWSSFDWETAQADDDDLIPGDPYEIALLGKRMRDIATMIDTQAGNLRNLVDGNGWDSDAGRAFQKKVGDTADLLAKSHTRYATVGKVLGASTQGGLTTWAARLEDLQGRARTALSNGRGAHTESAANARKVAALPANASAADTKRAHTAQTSSDNDLIKWQKALEHLIDTRDTEANTAASAIRDAIDHDGLKNPPHHWWDGWQDLVADIGHWAGVAAGFLGVAALLLSWVPVLGEVLDALAAVAAVVALVADTISAIDGKGTWLDVAIDVVGVLSFGAGRVLGDSAKSAEAAARGSSVIKDSEDLVELGRSAGLSDDDAWEMVSSVKGDDLGDALVDVAGGPKSLVPSFKAMATESVNPKSYLNAIKDSRAEWGQVGPKDAGDYFRGMTNPAANLKGVMSSPFKTMAVVGRSAFIGSKTLPLAAGWANLASTDEPSNPATGPDFFQGLKSVPGVGASGVPGVNWSWSH